MAWDNVWERIFQESEWGKYPAESLIQFAARNFYERDRKRMKVLELGCGPGANIWYFAREGFDVYGIDGSATAISRAKERLKKQGLNAQLQIGDIVSLPYYDNQFDAVIDAECLYANSRGDTERILEEIKRVLKNNGLFYSRTFADDMYVGFFGKEESPLEYTDISDGPLAGKGFVRLMTKKDIEKLYARFFKIVSIDKLSYTYGNGNISVNEWIIVCQSREQDE